KFYLGAIGDKRYDPTQVAFTSIPDVGGLRRRTSVLADGVYAPPGWQHTGPLAETDATRHRDGIAGVITLVTVGTLGVEPDLAVENVPRMRDVIADLFSYYTPPAFPGVIDKEAANAGQHL